MESVSCFSVVDCLRGFRFQWRAADVARVAPLAAIPAQIPAEIPELTPAADAARAVPAAALPIQLPVDVPVFPPAPVVAATADFAPGLYRATGYELRVRSSMESYAPTLRTLCVGEETEVLEVINRSGIVFGRVAVEPEFIILYVSIYGKRYAERIDESSFVLALTLHVTRADPGFAQCSATNIGGDELASVRIEEGAPLSDVCRLIAAEVRMEETLVKLLFPDGRAFAAEEVNSRRVADELFAEEFDATDEDLL